MEFNIQRTLDVLVRKLCINRKSILIFASISFLIVFLLHFLVWKTNGFVAIEQGLGVSGEWTIIAMVIVAGIFPFLELTQKQNRAFELLYPASQVEKFVVEVLTCFIILPIIILVVDILAVYGGHLASKFYAMKYGVEYSLPQFSHIFRPFAFFREYEDYLLVLRVITISFFGAILFKKYRLLKIWLCVGLITLTIIIIISIIFVKYYDAEKNVFLHVENILNNVTLWNIVGTVFFLGVFFATWILYKNKRV